MNKWFQTLAALLLSIFTLCGFNGCIEESEPGSIVIDEQLENESLEGLNKAIAGYMNTVTYTTSDYTAIGYPGMILWREVMANDWGPLDTSYDYFTYYASGQYIGDYYLQGMIWMYYYYLIQKCNLLIGKPNSADTENLPFLGTALTYRALAYLDLARLYEYKHTGVDALDASADNSGIWGLTVPITTEKTTEADSRDNPRVPFYSMYRFILNDLRRAEEALEDYAKTPNLSDASLAVCHGMMARVWLELGTRFDRYPLDLDLQLQHEDDNDGFKALGIQTANDCFDLARHCAQLAIQESGCIPMTENDWYGAKTGFNTSNDAWMWAIEMGANDDAVMNYSWQSWVSFTSPEADYGVSGTGYLCSRMIDRRLFESISSSDWRRYTWIDPADFTKDAQNYKLRYQTERSVTSLSYEEWKKLGPYVGLKFHPAQGNRTTFTVGNQVDIPLMRVEEMYLIAAEATAHLEGWIAGASELTAFVSSYRDPDYTCSANDQKNFEEELLRQRRLEFWGEGLTMFDFKRLEHAVVRGYTGTNHPASYCLNSYEDKVAPWMNLYISSSEYTLNHAIILNPNPSGAIEAWEE